MDRLGAAQGPGIRRFALTVACELVTLPTAEQSLRTFNVFYQNAIPNLQNFDLAVKLSSLISFRAGIVGEGAKCLVRRLE